MIRGVDCMRESFQHCVGALGSRLASPVLAQARRQESTRNLRCQGFLYPGVGEPEMQKTYPPLAGYKWKPKGKPELLGDPLKMAQVEVHPLN